MEKTGGPSSAIAIHLRGRRARPAQESVANARAFLRVRKEPKDPSSEAPGIVHRLRTRLQEEPMSGPVIEVNHLHKRYRHRVAVQDVSFTVESGEIFGVVGPNGAGKTTTVECIAGLRT